MKRVILASLLLTANLQIMAATAPMIINRTGQEIKVSYLKTGDAALFATGNEITLPGNTDHAADKMVLIPSTTIAQPGVTPAANYQDSAVKATIKIGADKTVAIASFAANTSYVIEPNTASAGTFKATEGKATYDTVAGTATYGTPSPAGAGTGF